MSENWKHLVQKDVVASLDNVVKRRFQKKP